MWAMLTISSYLVLCHENIAVLKHKDEPKSQHRLLEPFLKNAVFTLVRIDRIVVQIRIQWGAYRYT